MAAPAVPRGMVPLQRSAEAALSARAAMLPTRLPLPSRLAVAVRLNGPVGVVADSGVRPVRFVGKVTSSAGAVKAEIERKEEKTSPPNAEKTGNWTIGEVHHKLRLDRAIKVLLGGASEKFLERAFRGGCISYNGRPVRVDQAKNIYVKKGDKVTLRKLAPTTTHELPDAEWRARVLHEDEHLLVIDKPTGLASAPTPSDPYNAVSALEEFLARRDGKPTTLRNVHRLDKETSGVLILAKSAVVADVLGSHFRANRVNKLYWAVLDGELAGSDSGLWSDRHDIDSSNRAVIFPGDSEEGKTAKTRFQVFERLPGATVVELRPSTGRMHQLRAQTAHRRAPIAGDTRYGEPAASRGPKAPRLCLHCAALTLSHPVETSHTLELRAPIPAELQGFVQRLRAAADAEADDREELPHEEVLRRLAGPRDGVAAKAAAAAAAHKRAALQRGPRGEGSKPELASS